MVIKLNKKIIVIIIVSLISILVIFNLILNSKLKEVNVKDIFVYGTHLNFKVINNKRYNTLTYDLYINDKVIYEDVYLNSLARYTLSDNINEGIYLEDINIGEYYLLFDNSIKIKCKEEFNKIVYYTLKENCNKITIFLDNQNYLKIKCEKVNKPNNIYDIVIDPGHGGKSTGAVNGKYKESDLTLDYSITLKEELEKIGYKVKLTREDDVTVNPYGKYGRVTISYDTKAKYFLSIHFNSNDSKDKNGFEIYTLNNVNLNLSRKFRDSIISNNEIICSNNNSCRYEEGIYIRTFNEDEIGNRDYISLNTPYYFMLRETGGFMTLSFIEMYKNYNYGAESFLFELGYISNNENLEYILNNKYEYIKGIVNVFKELKKSN